MHDPSSSAGPVRGGRGEEGRGGGGEGIHIIDYPKKVSLPGYSYMEVFERVTPNPPIIRVINGRLR